MNRFLKKEWEDTGIPEHAYLQARNRAWAKMHEKPKPTRTKLVWGTAGAALAVAMMFLWTSEQDGSSVKPNPVPLQATNRAPEVSEEPRITPPKAEEARSPLVVQKASRRKSSRKQREQASEAANSETLDRVVLNFVLPETGVRMIWILDKDFQVDGGIE